MLSDNDPDMLRDVVRVAREERRLHEVFWRKWVESLHGKNWRSGSGRKSQVNYAYVYTATFLPALAFRSPKIKLKPILRGANEVAAEVYQNALNTLNRENGLLDELRLAITDSFYAFGCIKTGLVGADYLKPNDVSADPGNVSLDLGPSTPLMPYAVRKSPFNMLWDNTATRWRSCQFIGDEFSRDIDLVATDPRYDLNGIDPENLQYRDDRGGFQSYKEQMARKMPKVCRMVELFLRDSRRLVTLLETGKDTFVIARSVPYWGPENGPYRFLQYTPIPDSVVPMSSGAGQWDQLVDLEEQQFALAGEIKKEKRFVAFEGTARKSAELAAQVKHDNIVSGMDKAGTQITYAGASPERITGVDILTRNYYFASAMSDVFRGQVTGATATESSLADRNANIRLDDMKLRIRDFGAEIVGDEFWYAFHDENVILNSGITMPGSGSTLELIVQGGPDYDPVTGQPTTNFDTTAFILEVDADSMYRMDGPLERAQALEEAQFMLGALFPQAMMFGYMPDFIEFTRQLGERIGRPGMERLLVPMTPELQMLYMQQQVAAMAQPGAASGGVTSTGDKPAVQAGGMPGGMQGQMMSDVMKGSQMMKGSGQAASASGQAHKADKGQNQHSFSRPKQGGK